LGTAAKGALDGSARISRDEALAAYTETRFFGTLILAVRLIEVVSALRTPRTESIPVPIKMKPVPAQDLRLRLGEYLDRANLSGDAFVVTRGDRPKAVLLGVTQFLEMLDRLEALEEGRVVPPRVVSLEEGRYQRTSQSHASMKVISITNLKGGVAKTTIVYNLAGVLAERKKRVLLIDMDYPERALTALDAERARVTAARNRQEREELHDTYHAWFRQELDRRREAMDVAEYDRMLTAALAELRAGRTGVTFSSFPEQTQRRIAESKVRRGLIRELPSFDEWAVSKRPGSLRSALRF